MTTVGSNAVARAETRLALLLGDLRSHAPNQWLRIYAPATMWIPRDADEIEHAARRGNLTETPSFDAKADLPSPNKNASLAVDVAAMTTAGGALLYGIGEDAQGQPTIPQPIALAGQADRVAQIVATSIMEVPYFEPHEFPCADDPSRGYLLLLVPASARAPHQVTVGKDLRFYGRDAKGNRILTEGEVARLYARRQEWEQDRDTLLDRLVSEAVHQARGDLVHAYAFVRPVVRDDQMWRRAEAQAGGREALTRNLLPLTSFFGG